MNRWMNRIPAVALILATIATVFVLTGRWPLRTPDQRGYGFYRAGAYGDAAEAFAGREWKGAALFREGAFEAAAAVFSGLGDAPSAYNQGTALILLGRYEEAVASFDRALEEEPGWEDAQVNRAIAVARAEALRQEGGEMTGGMLAADEILFSEAKSSPESGEAVVEEAVELSDAEMQAIWLRQVQTKPADFLRSKFAHQLARETSGEGGGE